MKRFPIVGFLLLIPALALLGTVGCSTKKEEKGTPAPAANADGKGKDEKEKPGKKAEITTALDATISGIVKFKGTPPEVKVDPRIAAHEDAKKGFCGKAADQMEQTWIIDKDGGVDNVIVMLAPPADKKFKKLDEKLLKTYEHPVVLDQPYCNYLPHVVALYADYQPLVVKNEAQMNHNVKIEAGAQLGGTQDFLVTPKSEKKVDLKFPPGSGSDRIINASCSIHGWMNSKIALFNNPYFAVTKDGGKFEIKNVPVDTEITIYLWHESFGPELKDKKKAEDLKTKAGDNTVKLEISK